MHFPVFLLFAALASSLPTPPQTTELQQQPLQPQKQFPDSYKTTQHLDPAPKSVELLFTSEAEEEPTHLWLPWGTRIYSRDYPVLPLHPATVKINNIMGGHKDQLARMTCVINPVIDPREPSDHRRYEKTPLDFNELAISFRAADGDVDLAEAGSRWFLAGREVESYECF
ncbi:hypothetical protein MBLNU459_g2675t1 [Dothideomycetes sp. NU459]